MTLLFLLFTLGVAGSNSCDFYGLTYSPYRALGVCPSEKQAQEDVEILLKHTSRVRTYSALCQSVNRVLMRYASAGKLSVLFGVWIDGVEMDQKELDNLMEILREFPDASLVGIAIGNEVAFRGSMSETEIAIIVNNTRKDIRQLGVELSSDVLLQVPVFTIEIMPFPELVKASDLVAVNIHPFYRFDLPEMADADEMSTAILEASAQNIDIYRNLAPDKQLIITEIGWPTDSVEFIEPNVGSLEVARLFMKKFAKYATRTGVPYYFFEIFDSAWKKSWYHNPVDALSEFNWGFYFADRAGPKYPECKR